MPLVLRAQALWNALIQQSGEELFQSCGVLNLGPQHSEFIRNAQQSAQKFRLNAQTLSAEQIAQRWPEFRAPEGYVGVFEPDAGFLRSELAVASLIAGERGRLQPVVQLPGQRGGAYRWRR